MQAALRKRDIVPGSLSTIWSTLRRIGLTHKERARGRQSRAGRTWRCGASSDACGSPRRTRAAWSSSTLGSKRHRFKRSDRGRQHDHAQPAWLGAQGKRLGDGAPFGHRCATTLLAGLRSTGPVAPLVLDGAMDGEAFLATLRQVLAPTLSPGDIVVMDNVPAHKVSGLQQAVTATGAGILTLPPCSPAPNPIGQVFAKLKTLLRKAATRTREAPHTTIATPLERFTPDECRSYITNSGYASE